MVDNQTRLYPSHWLHLGPVSLAMLGFSMVGLSLHFKSHPLRLAATCLLLVCIFFESFLVCSDLTLPFCIADQRD